jgi:hypothetical protein
MQSSNSYSNLYQLYKTKPFIYYSIILLFYNNPFNNNTFFKNFFLNITRKPFAVQLDIS